MMTLSGFVARCAVVLLLAVAGYSAALPMTVLPLAPDVLEFQGTGMVPLRPLGDLLGAAVSVRGESFSITRGGKSFAGKVGSTAASQNGQPLTLAPAPYACSEVIYVPLQALVTALGGSVAMDEKHTTATLTLPGLDAPLELAIAVQQHGAGQYADTLRQVYLLNLDTGDLLRLSYGSRDQDEYPVFSADMRTIAYTGGSVRRANNLYLRETGSSRARCLLRGSEQGNTKYRQPRFTPDGKYLVYIEEQVSPKLEFTRTICRIRTDGSARTVLATGDMPAVSPDGKLIAFVAPTGAEKRETLCLMNLAGEEIREIGPGIRPFFTADGQTLIYSRRYYIKGQPQAESLMVRMMTGDQTGKIYRVARDEEMTRTEEFLSFTPDGKIIFRRGTISEGREILDGIFTMTLERRREEDWHEIPSLAIGPFFTPDRKSLVYTSPDHRILLSKQLPNGKVSTLSTALLLESAALTPDGYYLLISAQSLDELKRTGKVK